MANERLFPKFCPVCGVASIQVLDRPGIHDLYRCGDGHFFIFELTGEQQRSSEGERRYVTIPVAPKVGDPPIRPGYGMPSTPRLR